MKEEKKILIQITDTALVDLFQAFDMEYQGYYNSIRFISQNNIDKDISDLLNKYLKFYAAFNYAVNKLLYTNGVDMNMNKVIKVNYEEKQIEVIEK